MIPQYLLQFLALVHTGSEPAASPGVGVWVAVALPVQLARIGQAHKFKSLVCYGNAMAESHLFFSTHLQSTLSIPSVDLTIKDHQCADI